MLYQGVKPRPISSGQGFLKISSRGVYGWAEGPSERGGQDYQENTGWLSFLYPAIETMTELTLVRVEIEFSTFYHVL